MKELVREFVDPLASVEACDVDSQQQATYQIEDLQAKLGPGSDWRVRVESMEHAMELLKGGIQYYQGGKMEVLMPLIANCVADLRPLVVKPAAMFVASLAQSLTDDFESGAEVLFPALLKQLTSANAQIANCAHLALLKTVRMCPTRKTGKMFIENYTSSVPANRQLAVEAAHIILETWRPKISQPLIAEVERVVAILQRDPFVSIRNIAMAASKVTRCGEKVKKAKSTLFYTPAPTKATKPQPILLSPPSSPKSPKKASPKLAKQPVKEEVVEEEADESEKRFWGDMPISAVKTPSNREEALMFKAVIDKLVTEDQVGTLGDDVQTLTPSLVMAAAILPGQDVWEEDMRWIFENYAKDLRNQIMRLMSAFNFEEWFIRIMEDCYPLQDWSETLNLSTPRQQELVARYFTSVFQMDPPPIHANERIRTMMEILVEKCKGTMDTSVLERVFEETRKPTDIPGAIRVLVAAIDRELPSWETLYKDVVALYTGEDDAILSAEQSFDASLPGILANGTDEQKLMIMSLIDLSATKLKKVSFASCTDRMLAMAEDDSCPLQMDAYECLSNMLNDVKVLAIAIQRLEQKQGHEKVILGAMLRYFTAAPPPRLIPTRKIVVRKVSPFMKSEDVNIRQCAVRILAEFKKKIPKEFHSLFKKLTPAQQRMVEYSAAQ